MIVPQRAGSCTACGVALGPKSPAYRVSQLGEQGQSAACAESFDVCAWCIEQLRVLGARQRAAARRSLMPSTRAEQYRRAKLRGAPWVLRRQSGAGHTSGVGRVAT